MQDKEYIEQLEQMVHFLSVAYTECKEEYYNKHRTTSSSLNPKRRGLTDLEVEETMRFPLIQSELGLFLNRCVKNTELDNKPIEARYIFNRLRQKYKSSK